MTVLVTGGAGYIGSHMTYALLDRGERVVVLDNLTTGNRSQVSHAATLVEGDIGDEALLHRVIREHEIDAVIHFAGSIVVPESVEEPLRYYANNTVKTRTLIEACVEEKVKHFVFSSTAAVYGMTGDEPILETAKQYLGPFVSRAVDWTPLDDWSDPFVGYGRPRPPADDVWQFSTFLVRGPA